MKLGEHAEVFHEEDINNATTTRINRYLWDARVGDGKLGLEARGTGRELDGGLGHEATAKTTRSEECCVTRGNPPFKVRSNFCLRHFWA